MIATISYNSDFKLGYFHQIRQHFFLHVKTHLYTFYLKNKYFGWWISFSEVHLIYSKKVDLNNHPKFDIAFKLDIFKEWYNSSQKIFKTYSRFLMVVHFWCFMWNRLLRNILLTGSSMGWRHRNHLWWK